MYLHICKPGIVPWVGALICGTIQTYSSHELYMGQLTFSLKKRKSEPSRVVLLCCLALFIVSQLFNHVPTELGDWYHWWFN